jgi:hypothetical protein
MSLLLFEAKSAFSSNTQALQRTSSGILESFSLMIRSSTCNKLGVAFSGASVCVSLDSSVTWLNDSSDAMKTAKAKREHKD